MIGGGQSGLAVGYYLRRTGLSYVILDNNQEGGGAWIHTWKSLRLFSPAQSSSLPGMIMPGGSDYYPTRDEAIDYLRSYERKYNLPVKRSEQVISVRKDGDEFQVETSKNTYKSKVLVSATGTFGSHTYRILKASIALMVSRFIQVNTTLPINSKERESVSWEKVTRELRY